MSKAVVMASWEDAPHLDEKTKRELLESMPPHEREARIKGIPVLGSGRVFPVTEEAIECESFAIPDHWPRICGVDFGWDHPTAAAWLAWDRDADTVYVYDAYRVRQQPIPMHATAINTRGKWIPVAWPHDGMQTEKGSGETLKNQYVANGVRMLSEHATMPDGSNSLEASVQEMLTYMLTGRFKVFKHLNDWWQEFRLYHREDGKIVKERDDILSACRYGFMMRRMAKTKPREEERERRVRSWRTA